MTERENEKSIDVFAKQKGKQAFEVMKKILILGSGALKIGEAGEFDYSGSQALKAFREEGITTVLINPNIATVQTSKGLADQIYFLPITVDFVTKVIIKEKPDAISLSFGGQTALNCGLKLDSMGILKKYRVKVLGTPINSVKMTEDRELFAKALQEIDVKVPKGGFAHSLKQAVKIGGKLGYPLLVRSGYSLGGLGSGVVSNLEELTKIVNSSLKVAPQLAIEEYLKHWKEIEYEVVRDGMGNKITVCNMENMDPLGIHTGESIVVAPSQTLNNYQYHLLRKLSLKVIAHLGIVGECNIQFALNPKNNDYRVIEVNARLSRSSALASKATGYPLAYIAAKLGLGYSLPELKNSVTRSTSAFFEPALDYIVIKIPRWDLQKFIGAKDQIGSEMKSVGEVMAIGRSFPEVLQKAVRMLETGQDGLLNSQSELFGRQSLLPSTQRLFAMAGQFAKGVTVEAIYKATGIDPWFLYQIREIALFENELVSHSRQVINDKLITRAKKLGFSDKLLAKTLKTTEQKIRDLRKKYGILPKVKHIDTLAAEYPAQTNYLYLTYHGEESEVMSTDYSLLSTGKSGSQKSVDGRQKAIVLGSGPYRIGSSVEFDWCAVTCAQALRQKGLETIMINCNPETVSTDYDLADKLYFEELTFERIADIYDIEKTAALVLGFGGQVPNNLAMPCYKAGMKILGTLPLNIDKAENRHKFSGLLDHLKIDQPAWQSLQDIGEAISFARKIGYPVLVRPSYVLSGSAMNIAYSAADLKKFLLQATKVSREYPVVLSKFIENSKEVEMDGVADGGRLVIYAISEHVENAGVHSGDATLVLPPQRLYLETLRKIKVATKKILKALEISGPFNVQYLAKDNQIKVIELNLRASRSLPFVSKVTGYNFVDLATRVILGEHIEGDFKTVDLDYVGVKVSQFSFNRIKGADPALRVEMASTGEVGCFGADLHEAYLKALLSTGFKLPQKSIFLSIGGEKNKLDLLQALQNLAKLGLKIYATEHTHEFLSENGIKSTRVFKIAEGTKPSILDLLAKNEIDLAINISLPGSHRAETDGFLIRRNCIDAGVPLVTNLQAAEVLANALVAKSLNDLEIASWDEYVNN